MNTGTLVPVGMRHASEGLGASFVRTVGLLWRRELLRLWKTPMRLVLSLITPIMFLVVFATGLDSTLSGEARGMESFRSYMFPGVLIMCVQAPAISSECRWSGIVNAACSGRCSALPFLEALSSGDWLPLAPRSAGSTRCRWG